MPSGITHMLLAKTFNEKSNHGNDDLEFLLDEKLKIFQVGSLGPDLAYSQQHPLRDLFNDEDENADLFHYSQTNQIPLRAFSKIRHLTPGDDRDSKFAFFLGYTAHIIADGIVHPFVRDKVGNYDVAASQHRALEMRLDAILLNHLAAPGTNMIDVNFGELHDQIKDLKRNDLKSISVLFSELLADVYGKSVSPDRIEDWVGDLHSLFEAAANKNNNFYAWIPGMSTYLYNDTSAVIANQEQDNWLRNSQAVGRNSNFVGRDIHFLHDCLPRFYKTFSQKALEIYSYVYSGGPSLDEKVIPAINLDTGRLLATNGGKNLDHPAILWEA